MRKILFTLSPILVLLLAGCAQSTVQQPRPATLSPDQAAGTAVVASKYTQAADATLHPPTPAPTGIYPTEDWTGWTPIPSEITARDAGKIFNFVITSRFSIVLKEAEFPASDLVLHCDPGPGLGRISNVETVPPDYYVVRYEAVNVGQCKIQNGQFEVIINITNH